MSTTFEVFPGTKRIPSLRELLRGADDLFSDFLRLRIGSLVAPKLSVRLLERESNAPVPFAIDDAAQWPPSVYAWFALDGIPGGTDAYFESFTADDRNIWLEEICTPHYTSWATPIKASLEVGHRWRFRRSAGQPCVITAAYGLLAASVARLTDGVIESGDSAWDPERLPAVPRDFIANFLNPHVEVQRDFADWTRRCLQAIPAELASLAPA